MVSQYSTSKAPDSLVDLMQMCKKENWNPDSAFVRQVHSSPILCTNQQLRELNNFPRIKTYSLHWAMTLRYFYVAVTETLELLVSED